MGGQPSQERCIYAIGDVHGRLDLLSGLLTLIRAHAQTDASSLGRRLVLLGDYVDRGPQSAQVIDFLCHWSDEALACTCLMGNHEAMMIAAMDTPNDYTVKCWLQNGGAQTLTSYGLLPSEAHRLGAVIPKQHQQFLRNLVLSYSWGNYFFVHAGIDPLSPWNAQDVDSMLWIRRPFLSHQGDFGRRVVHGHTVVDQVEIKNNRIGLDTGAYRSGLLSCAVLCGSQVSILQYQGELGPEGW